MKEQLRFAPIIRVSTEKQEQKGESLHTQRKQIIQYVKTLGGAIPETCWQYSGQEHATAEFERSKLDKLLSDAGQGLFDAVVVADASRWSRDNLKSKEGLAILREHGIRFFVGTSEYDLFNPEHTFFLGMAAEFGEFQARQQSLKSITNRIERAREGKPSAGKLPYGRTYDRETNTWGVDLEAQERIQWAADQYLKGVSMGKIATTLGMNHPNLWKILTQKAGGQWPLRFRVKKLGIDETVYIDVPPLLSDEVISAILDKSAANKTYTHGKIKNHYLLSRVIFCKRCGNAMFGQTNHGKRRYYRHPRGRNTPCDIGLWVVAEQIEQAVFNQLFEVFGNPELLKSAVQRATPDVTQIVKLQKEQERIEKDIDAVEKKRDRLIDLAADGLLSKEEIKTKIDKLRQQEELLTSEQSRIHQTLSTIPDHRKRLSEVTDYMKQLLSERLFVDSKDLPVAMTFPEKARLAATLRRSEREDLMESISYEERRRLVQNVFGGTDSKGRRLGVYVDKDEEGQWSYEIHGIIGPFATGSELNFVGTLTPKQPKKGRKANTSKTKHRTEQECLTSFPLSLPAPVLL